MSAPAGPPDRLTIATCIGCGAMNLPAGCAGGCGSERKLELVAGAELDELLDSEQRSGQRADALADALTRFLALPSAVLPETRCSVARSALRAHEHEWPPASEALAAEPEPVVGWWCEHCGGLDAPAPCVGVCIRRPAQWATLQATRRQRAAVASSHEHELRLAQAVRALVLTRPRPGRESQHWRGLRETAARALRDVRTPAAAPGDGDDAASAAAQDSPGDCEFDGGRPKRLVIKVLGE